MFAKKISKVGLLGITCGSLLILYTIADILFIKNMAEYDIPFIIGLISITIWFL